MTQPDAIDRLRRAAKNGAIGFGEIKSQVAAAGPEMQRLYALAAETERADHDPLSGGQPARTARERSTPV